MLFFFCYFFQCAFSVIMAVGIAGSGGGGWIVAFSTFGTNVGAAVVLIISAVVWSISAAFDILQLGSVRVPLCAASRKRLVWRGLADARTHRSTLQRKAIMCVTGLPPLPPVGRVGPEGHAGGRHRSHELRGWQDHRSVSCHRRGAGRCDQSVTPTDLRCTCSEPPRLALARPGLRVPSPRGAPPPLPIRSACVRGPLFFRHPLCFFCSSPHVPRSCGRERPWSLSPPPCFPPLRPRPLFPRSLRPRTLVPRPRACLASRRIASTGAGYGRRLAWA